jgi:hypothetical protein
VDDLTNNLNHAMRSWVYAHTTFVPVASYGSQGCAPIELTSCPMVKEDPSNTCVACVSGSGDSLCIGYGGELGNGIVACVYGEPF